MSHGRVPIVGPGQPIEVPDALRAAVPFAALALLSCLLLTVRGVPQDAAAMAAAMFASAAAVRGLQAHRALRDMQLSVDRVLLRGASSPVSPVLVWRMSQLCAPEARAALAGALRRAERSASGSHLAGASPLNRRAIRACGAEIESLAARLDGPDPVPARGVILVHRLLEDPASALYGSGGTAELQRELRTARAALADAVEHAS